MNEKLFNAVIEDYAIVQTQLWETQKALDKCCKAIQLLADTGCKGLCDYCLLKGYCEGEKNIKEWAYADE